MRIAIVPASPKTAAAAIRTLLHGNTASGSIVEIRAFYRDTKRAPLEFTGDSRFRALKGELEDPNSLDLADIDAILTITPPAIAPSIGLAEDAERASRGVKEATERAGCVKKLVLLSSLGAHLSEGVVSGRPDEPPGLIRCLTIVPG